MKTKKMMVGLVALAGLGSLNAQTTAYTPNGPAAVAGVNSAAFGFQVLFNNNTAAFQNTGVGHRALFSNTSANDNTATGYRALFSVKTTGQNTAVGSQALTLNDAWDNTAVGYRALANSVSGSGNAALGKDALLNMSSGGYNTASGTAALIMNTSGMENTACGHAALYFNVSGDWNTASGVNALQTATSDNNTAVGYNSLITLVTGNNNTGLGFTSDVSATNLTNATAIGNGAIVDQSNRVWLGDANVAINDVWSYGTYNTASDGRFKTNVSESDVKGLEFIKLLRPVVYNFEVKKATEFMTRNMTPEVRKKHMDKDFSEATAMRQSGFIAQEVADAAKKSGYNFDGVTIPADEQNGIYGIAYAQIVVPLVKAVQEQQKMIEEQKQLITELQQKNSTTTGVGQLTSDIQGFTMSQNEPNPFTHETVIKYTLPQSITSAYMAVYDLTGKQITTLPLEQKGSSSITITSQKLSAGIYIYSIVADGKVMDSKRMVVTDK